MNLKRAFLVTTAALMMPTLALAQDAFTARFAVDKDFVDGNPNSVSVTLECNTGNPLVQSKDVSEGSGVVFVVNEMTAGEGIWCEITEDGETGYNAKYDNGDVESNDSCYYVGVSESDTEIGELNTCTITNTAAFVDVDVNTEWDFSGAGGNSVDTNTSVKVRSAGKMKYWDGDSWEVAPKCPNNSDRWCYTLNFSGEGTQTVKVRPDYDGTRVALNGGSLDSAIEGTNDCGGVVRVFPNEGGECTFMYSVFFEGIPTLSQYGMAIMVILMLGVGFVGFRRFV